MQSDYLDSDKIYPPLSLLYLKSYLELFNIKVGLEDLFDFSNIEKYQEWNMFGVTVMTPQRNISNQFLHHIKQSFLNKKVVIGGPHPTHYFDDVSKEKWDYIVQFDGQRSLLRIMEGNESRFYIDKMNKVEWESMPRPDRVSNEAIKLLSNYNYFLKGKKSTTMLTSTGCFQKCEFCEEFSTSVRRSSLTKIKEELNDIKELGYEGVYIFDDLFVLSKSVTKPICDELKKRNLVYRCNGQAKFFNEELASILVDTGCVEIAFGAESGSQTMLNNINKGTDISQNYRFVELCNKYGIDCKAFLLIGAPGETRETIRETERFIENSGIKDFQLSIIYPYKGTKIRSRIDIGEDIDLYFEGEGLGAYGQKNGSTESVVRTKELSSKDLLEERDRIVNKFKPDSHRKKWS